MKTLTLLRHAKSSWDDPVQRDFDRPLNKRGRRAAQTVGRALKARGFAFDHVLASPAVRVIETLAEVGAGYGQAIEPDYDRRIYLAPPEHLYEMIQDAPEEAGSLLLVGHNPGLEQLALMLTMDSAERRDVEVKYPTATVARISLPVKSWQDLRPGVGTLEALIRPRDLDPELGPEEE